MKKSEPLFNKTVVLEKFPGKGGWTFARLPGISPIKSNSFGWRKVNGFIDSFELKEYKLMPMGNSELFLPVKAEIRKKIDKQEGDKVTIILYDEQEYITISPSDFIACLKDEHDALKRYNALSKAEQNKLIDWVFAGKTEKNIIDRIAKVINDLYSNY